MGKTLLSLSAVALLVAVVSGVMPASAAPSPRSAARPKVDARLLAPGRVVERIEIGRLGDSKPLLVNKRRLTVRQAARAPSFDTAAATRSLGASSTESCFYARPQWRRYNGFKRLSSIAWYYMEWCGRDGKVTRVMTLFCGGVGAQGFSYDGCKVRRTTTGRSRVKVSGTWRFPFEIGWYTLLTRTVTVSARHRATGRTSGTWWMYQ